MRKKKKKKYVHEDFLSMRKRMLNEISDENIIYEDFLFRTFELKGKKFNEFKELVEYAKDLIELYRKDY